MNALASLIVALIIVFVCGFHTTPHEIKVGCLVSYKESYNKLSTYDTRIHNVTRIEKDKRDACRPGISTYLYLDGDTTIGHVDIMFNHRCK